MRWQREFEVFEQKGDVAAGLGMPDQEQFAGIGGRHDDIEHLHRGEFFEDRAGHQAAGYPAELLAQRD